MDRTLAIVLGEEEEGEGGGRGRGGRGEGGERGGERGPCWQEGCKSIFYLDRNTAHTVCDLLFTFAAVIFTFKDKNRRTNDRF